MSICPARGPRRADMAVYGVQTKNPGQLQPWLGFSAGSKSNFEENSPYARPEVLLPMCCRMTRNTCLAR